MTFEAEPDDEATLINLRYALGDALEICRGVAAHREESLVIEQMLLSATLQVMLLLKLQQASVAAATTEAQRLSSAA